MESGKQASRDELLERAEELADLLPGGARNEMQKVLHYYLSHKDYRQLIRLLEARQPFRGKKGMVQWQGIRNVLRAKQNEMERYRTDDVAFILGWAGRLLQRTSRNRDPNRGRAHNDRNL